MSTCEALFNRRFGPNCILEENGPGNIDRVYFAQRHMRGFPDAEGFYVAAPQTMKEKVRGPMAVFDQRFMEAQVGEEELVQLGIK